MHPARVMRNVTHCRVALWMDRYGPIGSRAWTFAHFRYTYGQINCETSVVCFFSKRSSKTTFTSGILTYTCLGLLSFCFCRSIVPYLWQRVSCGFAANLWLHVWFMSPFCSSIMQYHHQRLDSVAYFHYLFAVCLHGNRAKDGHLAHPISLDFGVINGKRM